ncbi:ASCH domain-containing protein [Microbacterium sp. NPDC077663]|uniref:ASCH domain-containing protein n=1 Tax=Microbacterium sp. NPDC077663 TaxID=3364189 RepID=UPI0037CC70F5
MSESLSSAAFPLDRAAADRMWADYRAAHPAAAAAGSEYTVEHFGDSPRLADQLLEAVISGPKRATAELVAEFTTHGDELPRIGGHWIACDGTGAPRIIIRSTELRVGQFGSVDAAFAYDEGEDDRTLESWQREHRRYFTRVAAARGAVWSEEDEIVFERFSVVWPPEHAD